MIDDLNATIFPTYDAEEQPPPQPKPKPLFDVNNVERAIKVPPENIAYRLEPQDRDDILMHEELRELSKSAVWIGIVLLLAVVI